MEKNQENMMHRLMQEKTKSQRQLTIRHIPLTKDTPSFPQLGIGAKTATPKRKKVVEGEKRREKEEKQQKE